MGLSVSASAAIVLVGVVLIFGTLYPAIERAQEIEEEARNDWLEWKDQKQRAEMTISDVNYLGAENILNISLNNTGDTVLDINELEVLLDGVYCTDKVTSKIIDDQIENTDLWNPGQKLVLSLEDVEEETNRVLVVSEFGSGTYHVEGAG
ncbi:MAG: hypothetical protein ACOC55_03275 [Candidatus Natronoplasma sp.]